MCALTQLISLSHQMLRPGGLLNSQTTDTQFFSTLESDAQNALSSGSMQPHTENSQLDMDESQHLPLSSHTLSSPYVTNESKGSINPKPTKTAPKLALQSVHHVASIEHCVSDSPKSPDRQSSGPPAKWAYLDKLIDGPEFANTDMWTLFPLMKSHYPSWSNPRKALDWLAVPRNENELCMNFNSGIRRLVGKGLPSNCVQGEQIYALDYLVRLVPFMHRAVMDSDIPMLHKHITDIRNLLESMEILMDIDQEARDRMNVIIDEEITKI